MAATIGNQTFAELLPSWDTKYYSKYPNGDYPIPTPTDLKVSVLGTSTLGISFTDQTGGVLEHRIERYNSSLSLWEEVQTLIPGTTSWNDASLTPGTQYSYRARAYYSGFYSPYSITASGTTNATVSAPTYTPLLAENYSNETTGGSYTSWTRTTYSDTRSKFGTKSLKVSFESGTGSNCAGSEFFAGREDLPVLIPQGYNIWYRAYHYFPSSLSWGYIYNSNDKTAAEACGHPYDGTTWGKWLVFAPDTGTARVYVQPRMGGRRTVNYRSGVRLITEADQFPLDDTSISFPMDQWFSMQLQIYVHSDPNLGKMRLWIDEELVMDHTTQIISSSSYKIKEWGIGDYWNGVHYTDGGAGRDDFWIDDQIIATDYPGYGAPNTTDIYGNPFIHPLTKVSDFSASDPGTVTLDGFTGAGSKSSPDPVLSHNYDSYAEGTTLTSLGYNASRTVSIVAGESYGGTKSAKYTYPPGTSEFPKNWWPTPTLTSRVYVACHMRWHVTNSGSDIGIFKLLRGGSWLSSTDLYRGSPIFYETIRDGDGDGIQGGADKGIRCETSAGYETDQTIRKSNDADAWHFLEVVYDQGTAGNSDAWVNMYVDGTLNTTLSNIPALASGSTKTINGIMTIFDGCDATVSGVEVWQQDFYIDSTGQRVVLTDNATYASSTKFIVQPIDSWSDTSIVVTLELGGVFTNGETGYFHVFDADGAAVAVISKTLGS